MVGLSSASCHTREFQDTLLSRMLRVQAKYPCLLDAFPAFAAQANAKRVAVFLDYDGTLTPIVKNPDRAFMSDQARSRGYNWKSSIAHSIARMIRIRNCASRFIS